MGGCISRRTSGIILTEGSGRTEALQKSLTHANIEPKRMATRSVLKADVLDQRQKASMTLRESSLGRQGTRVALGKQPRSHRMSAMRRSARGLLVQNIEEAAKAPSSPARKAKGKAAFLDERLRLLGMASVEMEGDGNCQFRAFADQLFGSQQHHATVRAAVIAHMKAASEFFGMYFESTAEYNAYLRDMSHSRTWGDELTLRACVEAFECVAHVITSEEMNWHLVYHPDSKPDEAALVKICAKAKLQLPPKKKEVFINYISPIHYNAICTLG
jgi:hypothetical protein